MNKEMANPFKGQFEVIKSWFKEEVLPEQRRVLPEVNVFDFLQNIGIAGEERYTREILGHGEFKDHIRLQIYDLLKAIVLRKNSGLKALLIENNPNRWLTEIDKRFEDVLKEDMALSEALIQAFGLIDNSSLCLYESDFHRLYKDLLFFFYCLYI